MYSVILMTAMTASAPEVPNFGLRARAACYGCWGACYGCWGSCYGYASCWGCRGWSACSGCVGSGWGYGGCQGGCWGYPYAAGWGLRSAFATGHAGWHGLYAGTYDHHNAPLIVSRDVWGADYRYSATVPFTPAPVTNATEQPKTEKDPKLDGTARLIIEVPADATLYIDGQPTKSTAAIRHFYTPKLEEGQTYFYELRLETTKNQQPVTETKRVFVRANEIIRESFLNPKTPASVASK